MPNSWAGFLKWAAPFVITASVAAFGWVWTTSMQTAETIERIDSMERSISTQLILMQHQIDKLDDRLFAGR